MKANTMKKLLSAGIAGAMTASVLAGCAAAPAAAPAAEPAAQEAAAEEVKEEAATEEAAPAEEAAADEEVTITLGIWPEDTLEGDIAMHDGFVETMKELHPNVTCVPAYYKYATDTFLPMVESGNCPTVFESWFTEPQKLIKAGAVADITEEVKARGWDEKMNPAILELLSDADGHIYGIPRDGYALGLMCNKELFREAGLVNEDGTIQYPTTWQELAEASKTIKDATGSAGLCLLAKDNAGGWHFSNIAWAFGATELTKDNGDGTFTAQLDSAEAIEAMEFVKSLKWDYDVLTADPTNEDWGTGFTELGTGAAAMYIAANDAVNQPTQVNGLPVEELALVPVPGTEAGGQYSLFGGTPYMFSKDATEAEINAALDYIEIMGKSPEVTEESLAGLDADYANKQAEGVPVIQRFPCWVNEDYAEAEAAVIEKYQNVDPADYAAYFAATGSEGLHTEEPGLTQDMYAELTKVLQEVITNKDADVAALMKTANDNYQSLLDQQ